MSNQTDFASGNYPIFGTDIQITGYTTKLLVISHQYSHTPEEVVGRDGNGDTKMRVDFDIEQSRKLTLTVMVIGADAAGAAGNQSDIPIPFGTTIALTSTKHPYIAGNWRSKGGDISQDNTGLATWTINLVPKL